MSAQAPPQPRKPATDLEKQQAQEENEPIIENNTKEHDPSIVNWDGPDDPENPLNWSGKKKWTNGGLLAAMTFITCVYTFLMQRPLLLRSACSLSTARSPPPCSRQLSATSSRNFIPPTPSSPPSPSPSTSWATPSAPCSSRRSRRCTAACRSTTSPTSST